MVLAEYIGLSLCKECEMAEAVRDHTDTGDTPAPSNLDSQSFPTWKGSFLS